jgi:exosome complex component MTR3
VFPLVDLKTGVTPSASGSAYFELEAPLKPKDSLLPHSSALKLSCTVHGPRPLPRSVPYSPQLLLTAHIKYAPFATRHRRGYLRDSTERDLGAHLETALRGVIIGERWPKTGVDVVIHILEGEEDRWWGDEPSGGTTGIGAVGGWGMMTVLAGCITAASAALVDAGIDCVDMISGGTAAIIRNPDVKAKADQNSGTDGTIVLDPNPAEHGNIHSACVVGYLPTRDEVTLLWVKGPAGESHEQLIDSAVSAAAAARGVLVEAIAAGAEIKFSDS